MYSGKVAAEVFARIEPADTYIILGPNHTGMGAEFSVMGDGVWRTPLGDARIDGELAHKIVENSKHLELDDMAHMREHSIEVQLPLIQYLSKSDFMFVPIAVAHYAPNEDYLKVVREIGGAIAKACEGRREKIVVVASSDLTHYEPDATARKKDKLALDAVLALDEEKLLSVVAKNRISMCGFGPASVMLAAAKARGAKKAELVDYMTSGDTTGDKSAVVGYGGVVVN
jgi:AmmeMemoRadiSam system protein B